MHSQFPDFHISWSKATLLQFLHPKLPQSKVYETWAELSLLVTGGYHQVTTTCRQTGITFHSFSQLPEELLLPLLCLAVHVRMGRKVLLSKQHLYMGSDIIFSKARLSHNIWLTQKKGEQSTTTHLFQLLHPITLNKMPVMRNLKIIKKKMDQRVEFTKYDLKKIKIKMFPKS